MDSLTSELMKNIQIPDADGNYALHNILKSKGNIDPDIVNVILDMYPSVISSRNYAGALPIHLAALNGHYDAVSSILLMDCRQAASKTYYDVLPLHLAALGAHVKVAGLLVQYFPLSLRKRISTGQLPEQVAANCGNIQMEKFLRESMQFYGQLTSVQFEASKQSLLIPGLVPAIDTPMNSNLDLGSRPAAPSKTSRWTRKTVKMNVADSDLTTASRIKGIKQRPDAVDMVRQVMEQVPASTKIASTVNILSPMAIPQKSDTQPQSAAVNVQHQVTVATPRQGYSHEQGSSATPQGSSQPESGPCVLSAHVSSLDSLSRIHGVTPAVDGAVLGESEEKARLTCAALGGSIVGRNLTRAQGDATTILTNSLIPLVIPLEGLSSTTEGTIRTAHRPIRRKPGKLADDSDGHEEDKEQLYDGDDNVVSNCVPSQYGYTPTAYDLHGLSIESIAEMGLDHGGFYSRPFQNDDATTFEMSSRFEAADTLMEGSSPSTAVDDGWNSQDKYYFSPIKTDVAHSTQRNQNVGISFVPVKAAELHSITQARLDSAERKGRGSKILSAGERVKLGMMIGRGQVRKVGKWRGPEKPANSSRELTQLLSSWSIDNEDNGQPGVVTVSPFAGAITRIGSASRDTTVCAAASSGAGAVEFSIPHMSSSEALATYRNTGIHNEDANSRSPRPSRSPLTPFDDSRPLSPCTPWIDRLGETAWGSLSGQSLAPGGYQSSTSNARWHSDMQSFCQAQFSEVHVSDVVAVLNADKTMEDDELAVMVKDKLVRKCQDGTTEDEGDHSREVGRSSPNNGDHSREVGKSSPSKGDHSSEVVKSSPNKASTQTSGALADAALYFGFEQPVFPKGRFGFSDEVVDDCETGSGIGMAQCDDEVMTTAAGVGGMPADALQGESSMYSISAYENDLIRSTLGPAEMFVPKVILDFPEEFDSEKMRNSSHYIHDRRLLRCSGQDRVANFMHSRKPRYGRPKFNQYAQQNHPPQQNNLNGSKNNSNIHQFIPHKSTHQGPNPSAPAENELSGSFCITGFSSSARAVGTNSASMSMVGSPYKQTHAAFPPAFPVNLPETESVDCNGAGGDYCDDFDMGSCESPTGFDMVSTSRRIGAFLPSVSHAPVIQGPKEFKLYTRESDSGQVAGNTDSRKATLVSRSVSVNVALPVTRFSSPVASPPVSPLTLPAARVSKSPLLKNESRSPPSSSLKLTSNAKEVVVENPATSVAAVATSAVRPMEPSSPTETSPAVASPPVSGKPSKPSPASSRRIVHQKMNLVVAANPSVTLSSVSTSNGAVLKFE